MKANIHTAVTRIADLEGRTYEIEPRPRNRWGRGDYVLATVTRRPDVDVRVENPHGRRVETMEGETIVGALGTRRATRGVVGSWRDVDDSGAMHVMTGGGVLGRVTSASPFAPSPIDIEYEGHVVIDGDIARMDDYGLSATSPALDTPVVLVLGTSMSSGKTMSGRVVTRVLVEEGYDVAACKLTGAGTYDDIQSLGVAGADPACDFVDGGLPTTIVPEDRFRRAAGGVLERMQDADVVVAEVGASPLEPYNGAAAVDLVEDQVAFTLLCATDPYAVVGIEEAFGWSPDLVTGITTNTTAGIELVEQLADCPALNLLKEETKSHMRDLLVEVLPTE